MAVEFCIGRSVTTTWLIAPAATTNQDTPERGTGHKIVNYGKLLDNTSETILAKILMVGNADTSTVKG